MFTVEHSDLQKAVDATLLPGTKELGQSPWPLAAPGLMKLINAQNKELGSYVKFCLIASSKVKLQTQYQKNQ